MTSLPQCRLWRLLSPSADASLPAAARIQAADNATASTAQTAAEIKATLAQIACGPQRMRTQILSLIPQLLGHPDDEIRQAALQALGGTSGRLPMTWITQQLACPPLRSAAVEVLQRCNNANTDIVVFAVFHARPEVRRAWLLSRDRSVSESGTPLAEFAVHCLADPVPEHPQLALARIHDLWDEFSPRTFLLLVQLHHRRLIQDDHFEQLLLRFLTDKCELSEASASAFLPPWRSGTWTPADLKTADWLQWADKPPLNNELLFSSWLNAGIAAASLPPNSLQSPSVVRQQQPEQTTTGHTIASLLAQSRDNCHRDPRQVIACLPHKDGGQRLLQYGQSRPDPIDAVLDRFWNDKLFFRDMKCQSEADGLRLAAAILIAAQRNAQWNGTAALQAALRIPELLFSPLLPASVRDSLFNDLISHRHDVEVNVLRGRITDLLSRIVRIAGSGVIDLRLAAAVLSYLQQQDVFQRAESKLKAERIIKSAHADPDSAAVFFSLPDSSGSDSRNHLLLRLRETEFGATELRTGLLIEQSLKEWQNSAFVRIVSRLLCTNDLSSLLPLIETPLQTAIAVRMLQLTSDSTTLAPPTERHLLQLITALCSSGDSRLITVLVQAMLLNQPMIAARIVRRCLMAILTSPCPPRNLAAAFDSLSSEARTAFEQQLRFPVCQQAFRRRIFSIAIGRQSFQDSDLQTMLQHLQDQQRAEPDPPAAEDAGTKTATTDTNSTSAETLSADTANPSVPDRSAPPDKTGPMWLLQQCTDESTEFVQQAALQLLDLGDHHAVQLLQLLENSNTPNRLALAETIALWPETLVPEIERRILHHAEIPVSIRFTAGLAMLEFDVTNRVALLNTLRQILQQCSSLEWVSQDLWERLPQQFQQDIAWQTQVPLSAAATRNSIILLLEQDPHTVALRIHQLLEQGADTLDRSTLWLLAEQGFAETYPMIVDQLMSDDGPALTNPTVAWQQTAAQQATTQDLCQRQGASGRAIRQLQALISTRGNPIGRFDWIPHELQQHLLHSSQPQDRKAAAELLALVQASSGLPQQPAVQQLYATMAWGARVARKLLGTRIGIQLLGDDNLGYMRPGIPVIHITPLPILEQARNGEDVVAGLILHELGHHMYHCGDDYRRCQQQAHQNRLGDLWNIVLDEHLERRLRSLDDDYGKKLQRLNAYAFLHKPRSLAVGTLLQMLGPNAFATLTVTGLAPARENGHVLVSPGLLLKSLADAGSSFARFFTSLLLGHRSSDPKVQEALALFRGDFRKAEADRLYEITLRLREIFAEDPESMSQLIGNQASHGAAQSLQGDSQLQGIANGVTSESVNAHIQRVVDGEEPQNSPTEPDHEPPPAEDRSVSFQINVSPTEEFDEITCVRKMTYDRGEHKQLSQQIAVESRTLQQFLRDLGFGYQVRNRMTSGRSIDQSRLMPLVFYRDPRVMKSRRIQFDNDLFLSIVVDCSGSMSGREIDNARLFATLICDACVGLPNVDVRVFGFSDDTIYDAGNARECAAHALEAGGGNNDAAALSHAANAALRSRRKAKALVMISDGLPTECSTTALRGLVRRLTTRYGIICAQVATTRLSEICFPDYVELKDNDTKLAVRQFGSILRNLIIKAAR